MGKTFENYTTGEVYQADQFDGVDFDQDIVTGKASKYWVTYEGEQRYEISKETYEDLKEYYG